MRLPARAGLFAFVSLAVSGCRGGSSAELESLEGRSSYAIGVNFARGIERDEVPLDLDAFVQGVTDVLEGREPQLTDDEIGEAFQQLREQLQEQQEQQFAETARRNASEGEAYLAENGRRESVVTTESGLQYEVLNQGDGPRPSATDRVSVHYRGTLIDGTEFDSSYDSGQPATFPVNGVIRGWIEALQLMPVGSKYRLVIPSDLAYGESGSGATIGPNSTLVFEVELLEILER